MLDIRVYYTGSFVKTKLLCKQLIETNLTFTADIYDTPKIINLFKRALGIIKLHVWLERIKPLECIGLKLYFFSKLKIKCIN